MGLPPRLPPVLPMSAAMNDLLAAYQHASNHHAEIDASTVCGCFNCLQIFPPADIIAWTGWNAADLDNLETAQGTTALCPHCGSESVVGDASGYRIDMDFLNRMNQAWMHRTVIRPATKRK